MKTNPLGLLIIKSFEGFEAAPYRDPVGYWTIGYGHLISSDRKLNRQESYDLCREQGILEPGQSELSEDQAEDLLRRDIARFEEAVDRLVEAPLNENQFSALVSFTYNLGEGNLSRSTLLKEIHQGHLADAQREFGKWVFANGIRLAGLERRRAVESWLFGLPVGMVEAA